MMACGALAVDKYQAEGYVLLACKDAGIDKATTVKLLRSLWRMFDTKTEEEAEEQSREWYQTL